MSLDSPRSSKRRKLNDDPTTRSLTTSSPSRAKQALSASKPRVTYGGRAKKGEDVIEDATDVMSPPAVNGANTNGHREREASPAGSLDELLSPTQKRSRTTLPAMAGMQNTMDLDSGGNPAAAESDECAGITTRLSGRQRKKPRRYSVEMIPAIEPAKASSPSTGKKRPPRGTSISGGVVTHEAPTPTTTQRKRGRPRKNPLTEENSVWPDLQNLENPFSAQSTKSITSTSSKAIARTTPSNPVHRVEASPSKIGPLPRQSPTPRAKSVSVPQTIQAQSQKRNHADAERAKKVLGDPKHRNDFEQLRHLILQRISGHRTTPLLYLEDEYQKVHTMIQNTVVAGEGNSMLVIGPRGCGKTALINRAINSVAIKHEKDFHVIRLNGFLHTDDKIALKEIWRQLGQEMDSIENQQAGPGNYADVFASLLALLSHTPEESISDSNSVTTSKSVIFVIDEFDLFAAHPRQTLLYNLFDIAQSRKAPIAVFGVTTRIDVTESLEKRVKSRFSHRSIYVPVPKSVTQFRDICQSILAPDNEGLETDGDIMPKDTSAGLTISSDVLDAWKTYLTWLLQENDIVASQMRRIFYQEKNVKAFISLCFSPIASVAAEGLDVFGDFMQSSEASPDSKLHLLSSLSELELCLLIAAARLDIILDTDTCNFNMAYDEYAGLVERFRLQSSSSGAAASGVAAKAWSKDAALGAWESLEQSGLLVPCVGSGVGTGTEGSKVAKLCKVDVSLEEIGASGVSMSNALLRWCRSI